MVGFWGFGVLGLPSGQEIEQEGILPPDLALINSRIKSIMNVLGNFRQLREPGR